ncbi:MAG: hypothetical protein GF364_07080 [Candidatus Lokiarchaeota archaeon]|nr:hypothetical protein [Candidatus Lokiarchaeota archaeon]
MTNIGLLGDVSVGKTSILRMFLYYVNTEKARFAEICNGRSIDIAIVDFSGESTIDKERGVTEKETKTIHPNRVGFKDLQKNKNYQIFAPGGDRYEAVVRLGIITISRISQEIIVVFSLGRVLKRQFKFFDKIRHFPDEIYLCFNKVDLHEVENPQEMESASDEIKFKAIIDQVEEYFLKRNIKVKDTFFTCAELIDGYRRHNENISRMFLNITK